MHSMGLQYTMAKENKGTQIDWKIAKLLPPTFMEPLIFDFL